MGRNADIDRGLADAVELRLLASRIADPEARARVARLARSRVTDIGPSVPKTRAAKALGVSVTALDRWVERGALRLRPSRSSRQEIDTLAVIDLAVDMETLRESGQERGLLAAALARRQAALAGGTAMGSRGFFPDQLEERRQELRTLTPGERVAQAIKLSRTATKIAAAGARVRAESGAR
jgi:hypothetical protein